MCQMGSSMLGVDLARITTVTNVKHGGGNKLIWSWVKKDVGEINDHDQALLPLITFT